MNKFNKCIIMGKSTLVSLMPYYLYFEYAALIITSIL